MGFLSELKVDSTSLPVIVHNPISVKAIAGGLIALLGVGVMIGQSFQPEPTKAINQTKIEKSVKHK